MRKIAVASVALAVALASPAAATTGPFVGRVEQGQTNVHHYDNNPLGFPCITVMATYTVVMRYTPITDTLTLAAGGKTYVGSDGRAVVSFDASYCTAFTISVTGTAVRDVATYRIDVTRGAGGSVS